MSQSFQGSHSDSGESRVFFLHRHDTFGNAYAVNRDEVWAVSRPTLFDTPEKAKQFVLEHAWPEVGRFLADKPEASHDAIIERFCFGNDPQHLKARRVFLGPPPLELIKRALRDDGVFVMHEKDNKQQTIQ